MKKKNAKIIGTILGVIGAVLIMAAVYALSWICTCGIIKLITLCFGWTFSWGIATGIWLIMCLAKTVFKSTTTVKK
jgi:hypothetical protein